MDPEISHDRARWMESRGRPPGQRVRGGEASWGWEGGLELRAERAEEHLGRGC
jgi:hypothetical protein